MKMEPASEIDRMAANFEAEALGEARWLQPTFGEGKTVCHSLVAVALERAAMRLRLRSRPDVDQFGPEECMGQ